MSLSSRIRLIFILVISLTVLIASANWFGTMSSIHRQHEILSFSNLLKQDFIKLSAEEKTFASGYLPVSAQNVFSIIKSIQNKITVEKTLHNIETQKNELSSILLKLQQYRDFFDIYSSKVIAFQAIESRLHHEIRKLTKASQSLIQQNISSRHELEPVLSDVILAHLQTTHSQDKSLDSSADLSKLLQKFAQRIEVITSGIDNNTINLSAYRLNKTLTIYRSTLLKYLQERKNLADLSVLRQDILITLQQNIDSYLSNETAIVTNMSKRFLYIAVAITGLTILISIIVTIFLSRLIVLPLESLKQSALDIVSGNLNTFVESRSKDEIGQLGAIFNTMVSNLRSSFEKLETYKTQLESIVSSRTQELERKVLEKEKAEQDLIASQNNLQRMIDQIPIGIILFDTTLRIVQWNPASERIFGYSQKEAIGKQAHLIVPPDNQQHVKNILNQMTHSKMSIRSNNENITKSGARILCDWHNTPFLDYHGKLTGIISIVEDITAKIKREKEFLRTAKLQSAGVLAGGIAHDFNNILTAILGNINLALLNTDLDDKTRNHLISSEKASIRAKSLTHQLLTFAKGGDPVKQSTAIHDIIKDTASFILSGTNISIDYQIAEDISQIHADKGQISQVIQNILLNSRQAMPEGGKITIVCRNAGHLPPQLQHLKGDIDFIHISLKDQGGGILPEIQEKIFDPYFSTKEEGSGLGLAVCHSIIEKHQGFISVDSQPGEGCTFNIYLPSSKFLSQKKTASSPGKQSSQKWRILVMDDEKPVVNVLTAMLEQLGHRVSAVHHGEDCFKIYTSESKKDPYDLVIMDLTIPGRKGGKETAKDILNFDSKAMILVASGYSNDPIMSSYKDHGFIGAISKPFTTKDIQNVINSIQS